MGGHMCVGTGWRGLNRSFPLVAPYPLVATTLGDGRQLLWIGEGHPLAPAANQTIFLKLAHDPTRGFRCRTGHLGQVIP